VRRCLGASFAIFEMKAVLSAIVAELELEPSEPRPERITRRAITFTPSRGTRVIVRARRAPATARPDVEWAAA
jgi:cytochrome P450